MATSIKIFIWSLLITIILYSNKFIPVKTFKFLVAIYIIVFLFNIVGYIIQKK